MGKSITISLSIVIAISIVTYGILNYGSSINLEPTELYTKILLVILTAFHAIFAMVFFGNLFEYMRKDVTPLVLLFVFIIELIYIYLVGLTGQQDLFSGSVIAIIVGLMYTIFSS